MKALVAAAVAALFWAGSAHAAAPTCTTTTTLASGGTTNLAGLSGGNCVQVGDKIFGSAGVGGMITGQAGSTQFTINVSSNSVTVNFQGSFAGTGTGNIDYSVAVAPGSPFLISAFQQDLTLNGLGASTTLVGGGQLSLTCSRSTDASGNAGPSTCPILEAIIPNLQNLSVTQTFTNNTAGTEVTAITDTIFQQVPEPTSLALLGTGLVGLFGLMGRRRRTTARQP